MCCLMLFLCSLLSNAFPIHVMSLYFTCVSDARPKFVPCFSCTLATSFLNVYMLSDVFLCFLILPFFPKLFPCGSYVFVYPVFVFVLRLFFTVPFFFWLFLEIDQQVLTLPCCSLVFLAFLNFLLSLSLLNKFVLWFSCISKPFINFS